MPYTAELAQELNTLLRYDLTTNQQGLKIHKTADAEIIAATQRLYTKGLVSQADGGYLTPLGREAAAHAQTLLSILVSEPKRNLPAGETAAI